MIRAEGLTKYYESRCVVRNLSFAIADREIVGFLGLNGAGKTTALRMLAGLLTPSSGRILIDERDLLADPLALRWRIGFLPERPPLYEDMAVRDYLAFAAQLRGYPREKIAQRTQEVLDLTDLGAFADEPIRTLSHGFRQRAGIAQAIVHDPALVILDEPINGLDPVQIVEMRGLIRSLKERHTVLVSSHILPEISQTCDRLLILHQGALVAQGSEAELSGRIGGQDRALRLEVAGEEAAVVRALKSCDVVRHVEVLPLGPGSGKAGPTHFESLRDSAPAVALGSGGPAVRVRVELSADAPELIAAAVVGAGLGLRRLEAEETELESMFLRLTGAKES